MKIELILDKKAIGKRIRHERKKSMYSQDLMAESLGVTGKYLSRIETGTSTPSLQLIVKFSQVTGASLDYIVKGESMLSQEVIREGELNYHISNILREEGTRFHERLNSGIMEFLRNPVR